MTSADSSTIDTPAAEASPCRRSFLPRFGLRSLLIFAILFCLLFGWIGRNLYRVRQEEAAIETLRRAGATVYVRTERRIELHPTMRPDRWIRSADWTDLPSLRARATGVADAYPVFSVDLTGEDPHDPLQKEALAALATFPLIEAVELEGAGFDDESLPFLNRLPRLNGLALWRTEITGEGLAVLSRSPSLTHVSLGEVDLESDIVAGLSKLSRLQSLQLSYRGVSRDDVQALAAMPNLRRLALTFVTLDGDDVFSPLAEAESVRDFWLVLDAPSRPLTVADVRGIAKLPNVRVLTLQGFDPAFLELLDSVESLRHLHFIGSAADRRRARSFSKDHPGCLVQISDGREPPYFLDGESLDREAGFELSEKLQER